MQLESKQETYNAKRRANNAKRVIYNRLYRKNNPLKNKEWQRRKYQKHKVGLLLKMKEYYQANRDKKIQAAKEYRLKNIDAVKQRKKIYYLKNKAQIIEKQKLYVKKNIHKVGARIKKWMKNNPDKMQVYRKKWIKNNRLKYMLCHQNSRLARKNAGYISIEVAQTLYENNIKSNGTLKCYLCNLPIKFGEDSIDHVIPISKGGKSNVENLEIVHALCNSKKSNKIINRSSKCPDAIF